MAATATQRAASADVIGRRVELLDAWPHSRAGGSSFRKPLRSHGCLAHSAAAASACLRCSARASDKATKATPEQRCRRRKSSKFAFDPTCMEAHTHNLGDAMLAAGSLSGAGDIFFHWRRTECAVSWSRVFVAVSQCPRTAKTIRCPRCSTHTNVQVSAHS